MNELLGKYAIFVAPAYILTLAVFIGLSVVTARRMIYWEKRANEEEKPREKKAP